jgi:hypothetical protein
VPSLLITKRIKDSYKSISTHFHCEGLMPVIIQPTRPSAQLLNQLNKSLNTLTKSVLSPIGLIIELMNCQKNDRSPLQYDIIILNLIRTSICMHFVIAANEDDVE